MKYSDIFVHSYEKRLNEENNKYWKKEENEYKKHGDYIFVYHEFPRQLENNIIQDIVAKGLQKKENIPVIALQYEENRKACAELDQSFGFKSIVMMSDDGGNAESSEKNDEIAENIADEMFGNQSKILELQYRGIDCGDAVYDQVIRAMKGRSFDWNDAKKDEYIRWIRRAVWVIDYAYELFEYYHPKYMITTEWGCVAGLVACVAQKKGAVIFNTSMDYPDKIVKITPDQLLNKDVKISDILHSHLANNETKIGEYSVKNNLFLYKGKFVKNDVANRRGRKKNVFIMLHALSDLPRESSHLGVYVDYNEWFLDTMKQIKRIEDVNWYVKDHPQSLWYRQERYVKKIFEKYKADHIYWCDREMSGMQIKEMADCIITYSGDVGIEYWAYGVPTVSLAGTHYSDWGISYQMKSLEEYYDLLENIEKIAAPSAESVHTAEKYMNVYAMLAETDDVLASILAKNRREKLDLFISNDWPAVYETYYRLAESYIKILKEGRMEDSSCYKLDFVYEV